MTAYEVFSTETHRTRLITRHFSLASVIVERKRRAALGHCPIGTRRAQVSAAPDAGKKLPKAGKVRAAR